MMARAVAQIAIPTGARAGRLVPWAALGVLVLVPLFLRDPYTLRILNFVGINSLLAMGLNLVVGMAGQISMGQAGFYGVGAYTAALLAVRLGLPFWATLPAAGVAAGALGVVIGPVLRLRGVFLAVATLAFGEIVRIIINNLTLTNGPNGIPGIPAPTLGSFRFDDDSRYYYLVLFWVIVCYVTIARMSDSRIGRALRAVRDNEDAAEVMGVHVIRYKIMAFAVAAAFAGVAGALLAHLQTYISPETFTFLTSVDTIFMVVVGGLGSVPGSILGAFVVVVGPEWLRALQSYRLVVYALVILAVVLFFPRGLYGVVDAAADRARRLLARAAES